MKVLTHTLGSFLTGDAIADAVLTYAVALSHQGRSDVIEVPFVAPSGVVEHVQMIVGWSVELVAVTQSDRRSELVDDEATTSIEARTHATRKVPVLALAHGEIVHSDWLDAV